MIQQEKMRILNQVQLAKDIYALTLQGSMVKSMNEPGQFVHVRTNPGLDPLLRRPISIASIDKENNCFTIIYRAEGKGTKLLSMHSPGSEVDVLGPLGNGFPIDVPSSGDTALLVGGGIGVPPLYELAKQLNARGVKTIHVLGFESDEKTFYEQEFTELGETYIATVDGTRGTKGFVTDVIDAEQFTSDILYSCGPTLMLKALEERFYDKKAYLSLEQRMGCGIGACFACVCHVIDDPTGVGYVKVCSDGPVFAIGKVAL
ncbi:dihydroorotate dehydrogenase electron transfer subunit [Pseudogracilibacillus auburnensis]|uniref:dihydroorotate dehydrogenase electron transfer subunit n=1 Tax=Pseudogracilibacillus auburnensis TaxID=1494959 RepID=UPI001A970CD7|nr:dihydroorotate dehydrogenase electron transfer subunit [Pseudogracilibacillus auburnensis]MBO1004961.1 dihydroorotate dehydrogenase electron transfer subunit [Pseudogracilibacillus auburnensis]